MPVPEIGCPRKWHFGIPRNTEVISGSIPAKFRGIPRIFAEFRRNWAEITSEVKKFRGIPCRRNSVDTLPRKQIMPAENHRCTLTKRFSTYWRVYNTCHYWNFYQNKKPIWKILRTDKNNTFEFTIKFLMTLDMSYIGYLGCLGIDLFKSVLKRYCDEKIKG